MIKLPKTFLKEFGYTDVDSFEYIRDRKNKPIGVFVTRGQDVGWSLCHDGEKWNVAYGLFVAVCRLHKGQVIKEVYTEVGKKVTEIFDKNGFKRIGIQRRFKKFYLFRNYLKKRIKKEEELSRQFEEGIKELKMVEIGTPYTPSSKDLSEGNVVEVEL